MEIVLPVLGYVGISREELTSFICSRVTKALDAGSSSGMSPSVGAKRRRDRVKRQVGSMQRTLLIVRRAVTIILMATGIKQRYRMQVLLSKIYNSWTFRLRRTVHLISSFSLV